ncbi:MAG: 30S ribosomal protein S3 [Parcubacteria group bacterium]|nr:30S ribosomal protein S3 [Parcubacteria group bacterium]
MGHKTNPKILRIPILSGWESRWIAKKNDYRAFVRDDVAIRKFLKKAILQAGVDHTIIERVGKTVRIVIYAAKPGLIIGKGGGDIEKLKKEIKKIIKKKDGAVEVNVYEVEAPMLSAAVILEDIIQNIEKRIPFRRSLKRAIDQCKKGGCRGVRIKVGGRLDGAEIARDEMLQWGEMPLSTLRADIDYARGAAHTTYGAVGAKVWIYRGMKFEVKK